MTTAAVVTFDCTDWHLDYSYAGHPPIYRAATPPHNGKQFSLDDDKRVANLLLECCPEAEYEQDLPSLRVTGCCSTPTA